MSPGRNVYRVGSPDVVATSWAPPPACAGSSVVNHTKMKEKRKTGRIVILQQWERRFRLRVGECCSMVKTARVSYSVKYALDAEEHKSLSEYTESRLFPAPALRIEETANQGPRSPPQTYRRYRLQSLITQHSMRILPKQVIRLFRRTYLVQIPRYSC